MDGACLAPLKLETESNPMTHDDLADAFRDLFQELHSKIDALPDTPGRRRGQLFAAAMHRAADSLATWASGEGLIQTFDGTNKPPPGP